MKRWKTLVVICAVLLIMSMLCMDWSAIGAPTRITNQAALEYTDANGERVTVLSNETTTHRVIPPHLSGVPARVIQGQTTELTVTVDIGGNEWQYNVNLPLNGATYVADSLDVIGTTGTVKGITDTGILIQLNPLASPTAGENLVTIKYKVKWK